MKPNYVNLPITVDVEDYDKSVRDIIAQIKPEWDSASVNIEKITKGFINCLLVCSECNDSVDADKIIVRVFGGNLGSMERCSEIEVMRIVSEKGIMPPVYGSFENGVVYGYAPGNIPTRLQLTDEKILRHVASEFHAMHSLSGEQLQKNIKNSTYVDWLDKFWTLFNTNEFKTTVEDPRFKDIYGSLEEMKEMKSQATSIYEDLLVQYPPVFCHMDAHNHNMVYDPQTEKVTFLDWEICHMGPEILDLSVIVDRDPDFHENDPVDNPEGRGRWVRAYLSTHPSYKSQPITDEIFQTWYRDSLRASIVSTLVNSMWGLFSVVHSTRDFDFFFVAKYQMNRLRKYRNELSELK